MLRNITLSADADLIRQARQRAGEAGTTLNNEFRAWLATYVAPESAANAYDALMRGLRQVGTDEDFQRGAG